MFIQREYERAQEYFVQAIREEPTNHSFWNKYGAALAQKMKTPESIKAYE
jgi:Tfp pilus assembly protein PilF